MEKHQCLAKVWYKSFYTQYFVVFQLILSDCNFILLWTGRKISLKEESKWIFNEIPLLTSLEKQLLLNVNLKIMESEFLLLYSELTGCNQISIGLVCFCLQLPVINFVAVWKGLKWLSLGRKLGAKLKNWFMTFLKGGYKVRNTRNTDWLL